MNGVKQGETVPVKGAIRLHGLKSRKSRKLSFLYDLSGNSDSWVSTGLYLLEGQNVEVCLSEAAASAGLKVRPNSSNVFLKHTATSFSPTVSV